VPILREHHFIIHTKMDNYSLPGFAAELSKHGDGVKDVAFTVEDCRGIYQVLHMFACRS
jgi:hypothetical protein